MGNDIFLTNNLSNKKEKFVPIDEKNIRKQNMHKMEPIPVCIIPN